MIIRTVLKYIGLYDPAAWAVDTTSVEAKPKWKALLQYRPFTSRHPHIKLQKEWMPGEGTQDRVSARGGNGSEKGQLVTKNSDEFSKQMRHAPPF